MISAINIDHTVHVVDDARRKLKTKASRNWWLIPLLMRHLRHSHMPTGQAK